MTELSAVSKLALESALTEPSAYTEIKTILEKKVIRQSADTDTALTLTTADSGALVLLDEDEAYTITLPYITASDIGTTFTFQVTLNSNNDRYVTTPIADDFLIGAVQMLPSAVWGATTAQDGLAVTCIADSATDRAITFDNNLANGGGSLGSTVTLTAVLAGNVAGVSTSAKAVWSISGYLTTADPNSDGTAVFTA